MTYTEGGVTIRPIMDDDLHRLWELSFKEDNPEWKKWDAPYYEHKSKTFEEFLETKYVNSDNYWAIEVDGQINGIVSYYWEHKPSLWLEIGITIYDPKYWNGGIGTKAMKMWIEHLFYTIPLVRVGYTTWSGNERMIRLGERLGFTMEARIRKVRYWNGIYYDSIRMGMLREEWEQQVNSLSSSGSV